MKAGIGMGLTLLALGAGGLRAQAASDTTALPDADAIYTRFLTAVGGAEAISAQTTRYSKGRIEVASQGLAGDIEVFAAAPDRLFVRTEIPGIGVIRTGYNGEVGWIIHPAIGAQVMSGLMLDQARQEADFYGPLHRGTTVTSATTRARTTFEGHSVYDVELTTAWDETYHEFYDVDSGLLVGTVRKQATPGGLIETTTVLSGYQPFGGVQVPTRSVLKLMGIEQVLTVSSIDVNVALADSLFMLPPEIRAQVGN